VDGLLYARTLDDDGRLAGTFQTGLSGIWWQWVWLPATPFYWIIAPIMRRLRAITTADVYALRYDRSVAVLFALVGIANLSVKVGLLLKGAGELIDASTGGLAPFQWAVAVVTVLFVVYGTAGGRGRPGRRVRRAGTLRHLHAARRGAIIGSARADNWPPAACFKNLPVAHEPENHSMKPFVTLLVLLCSTAAVPAANAAEGLAGSRPNVILVLTDDQGYGDLSCHGNPVLKTPNLDRLYAESIRLTDFHVAPMCTPTRGELLSGVDCLRNGAMNVSSGRTPLRRELPTMADLFAEGGYVTGQFGKWHLGDNYPYRPQDRGFQESIWFPSSHIPSAADYWNNDYFDDVYRHNGRREPFQGYCTDVFFSEAVRWMRGCAERKEPFFCYVPLNAAHSPLFVPDKYREPYRGQPRNVASFFGMIANIDENMGKLDVFLRECGLRENTILIFMTDNGGTVGVNVFNAGMRGRKIDLYDGGHRVPCFLRWPAGKLRPAGDVAVPIVSGVPEYQAVDGRYPPGVALPVGQARLHVADVDETKPVRPGDQAVAYTVSLKAGRTQLQTWFCDNELKGPLPCTKQPGNTSSRSLPCLVFSVL